MTSETLRSTSPQEMAEVGLRICRRIARAWDLNESEQIGLLGIAPQSNEVHPESLERFSYILGIYKNLRILYPTEERANQWVKRPNRAFGGKSALEIMIEDPAPVRRYLDAQLV
ncbi:MbcA/ParS/Xre antitoxin family protein [Marinobacter sp. MDS2]|uniref:MbcA/ParS/Xre antitoxin family protein n=1 Tax=Marinobacter sp. MDS2 TaxID=3065961 RepID=UPI00273C17EA|nr:MbcA/ParS/Xre antitoxin family protein [Marinobacter sp. MDS2]MDP4549056.1 MbcA/ParS/Xre antitoxin family protein [Marinobacter sp. MDS2]